MTQSASKIQLQVMIQSKTQSMKYQRYCIVDTVYKHNSLINDSFYGSYLSDYAYTFYTYNFME